MRAAIVGIGVAAPGIPDWSAACALLAGDRPYEARPLEYRAPESLAGAERRRAPVSVRLALDVAEQARRMAGLEGRELAAVFGSMTGDGPVITRCLEHLSETPRYVSPTDFHNSVHNAAVGYWAIGAGSHRAATSLSASGETFAAALLKAILEVGASNAPVLLCVYDIPHPPPLAEAAPVAAPFGAALVLRPPDAGAARATARLKMVAGSPHLARPRREFWAYLFDGNPAARTIPLLERLADPDAAANDGPVCIGRVGSGSLVVDLAP